MNPRTRIIPRSAPLCRCTSAPLHLCASALCTSASSAPSASCAFLTNKSETLQTTASGDSRTIAAWRGGLRLTLSGHNLFNNEYYSEGDLELASPGAPRQILFTTSVTFK